MDCFTKEMKGVLNKLYNKSIDEAEVKVQIAKATRVVEMIGLSVSLLALISSLAIFFWFSCLRNRRNHLHKNLFSVMLAQVAIRLTLYTDQMIVRVAVDNPVVSRSYVISIEKSPIVCEIFYILLEYSRTAVFVWMFLEGVHLHSNVSVVFPSKVRLIYFHLVGWGVPTILVIIWATVMITRYTNTQCWWGYSLSPFFWILEGPRMLIVLINSVILLNIVCVIANRVQTSNNSEVQQIRKAVRATLLLLPLLGIPNLLDIIPAPLERSPLQFAVWSYTTHILSSSQGFFIAFLYCFLNREVQVAVHKQYRSCLSTSFRSA
ncbi:PDF receptor-like [Centruroides sculpturatus]|uniref:PDF receptor-like n=1 Tax=Centruroides sculpturatus TaxID=218467 RepID=UPI000C6CA9E3|nr:PDF receptor-like [Centruroides sculpturatus]